jgi:hypothetical protein
MGLPARRLEQGREGGARLRLVRGKGRKPSGRTRPRSRSRDTAARELFKTFALALVVLAALGVGRVALSAHATEVSLRSAELRLEIKAARYRGDMLEVQQMALSSPSRIRSMTADDMTMIDAGDVCYIDLRGDVVCDDGPEGEAASKTPEGPRPKPGVSVAGKRLASLVSSAVEVAAGEARVLLVGDVGLEAAE